MLDFAIFLLLCLPIVSLLMRCTLLIYLAGQHLFFSVSKRTLAYAYTDGSDQSDSHFDSTVFCFIFPIFLLLRWSFVLLDKGHEYTRTLMALIMFNNFV